MARRKRGTPEQQARRELISDFLSAANVQSMEDLTKILGTEQKKFMYPHNTNNFTKKNK